LSVEWTLPIGTTRWPSLSTALSLFTHTHADTTKIAGSTVIERTCNPSDRGCAKLHPTIHCPSTEISLGRGLELLLEDGCLRGERASGATGYARWKAQRPVAFLNRKKSKHSDKKRLLELWLSNHVTPTFDAGPLSSEVRVPWGPPIKCDSHNFLLA
jgi:hypothetical protein